MGKIIAFANQKGGVGKTTCVLNLGAYISSLGYKVLLVDTDPQGNLTTGLGIMKNQLDITIYDVFMDQYNIIESIIDTNFSCLSIIPGISDIAGIEVQLIDSPDKATHLKAQINKIKDNYDFIFIDCPPTLGLITINALVASDSVIIPMQSDFFSLEGLSQLNDSIRIVREQHSPSLSISGIIFTMFSENSKFENEIFQEVQKFFPDRIFNTRIPRDPKIIEAPSHGQPITHYSPDCIGSRAYKALGNELISLFQPNSKHNSN